MNHWHSLKELIVCTVVVIAIGMAISIMMINDRRNDNVHERMYYAPYDGDGITPPLK